MFSAFSHRPRHRVSTRGLLSASFTVLMLAGSLATAHAYTFTVTNTSDDDGAGDCVDGGGACSLRQAINASEAQVGADLISFDPAVFATPQTISQGSRFADIHEDLTIQGPTAALTLSVAYESGNGLVSRSGTLTVSSLTFSGAPFPRECYGIYSESPLVVSNCTFQDFNTGLDSFYSTTVKGCTFLGNSYGIGALVAQVDSCLFASGFRGFSGSGQITNSTFFNLRGSEFSNGGPFLALDTTVLRNCTITGNQQVMIDVGGAITLTDCIIAGNDDNGSWDASNLVGSVTDVGLESAGGVAVLKDNGGPTQTVALLPGSPAIDWAAHTDLATDQRGVARPQGPKDDAGAYEYVTPDTAPPGVTVTQPTANRSISTLAWVNGFVYGTATDNQGVAAVQVKFYKGPSTDRWYWDGSQFVRTSTALAATLASPGATSTTWALSGPNFPEVAEIGPGSYSVTINAVDGANNISNVITRNFTISAGDVTPPSVDIEQPLSSNPLTAFQFLRPGVSGFISDDTAVGSVTVKFYSNIGGVKKYWDGSNFVTSQVNAPASLTAPGSTLSSWNIDSLPAESALLPGSYALIVSGTDAAGNVSAQTTQFFSIAVETTPPTGAIISPASSVNVTAADFANTVVHGTANDDVQLGSVAVKLYANINGVKSYWDGTSFQSLAVNAPVLFSVQNFVTGFWQINKMPTADLLPPGSYGVNLIVRDAAGNLSPTITRTFNIVSEVNPPSGTIIYPGNVQSVTAADFAANTVNGTAADDAAVSAVTVKLSRNNAGVKEYWGSAGWQTTSTLAPCTVNGIGQTNATWQLSTQPVVSDVQTSYSFTVTIIDHDGNTKVLIRNVNIVPDTSAPVIHIYTPVTGANYSPTQFSGLRVEGDATDDVSIAGISVKLYRNDGGNRWWWDGGSWVSTAASLPLEHDITGLKSKDWLVTNLPPADQLDENKYTVSVTVWDPSGNRTILTRSFQISNDQELPIVAIKDPAASRRYIGTGLPDDFINGTALDNLGVASGSVKLYCTSGSTRLYWNGSDFTPTSVSIPMTLSGSDPTNMTWTLSLPPASLDAGSYTLLATAKDVTGNLSPSVTRVFNVIADPASGLQMKKEKSSVKRF